MTQAAKVLEFLKINKSITALEMIKHFYITAPHSVIRDLRKKYTITDDWEYTNKSKHKRYMLDEQGAS